MRRVAVLCGLTLVALGVLGVSSAAVVPLAGSLDPSFGNGGVVTHSLSSNESGIRGVAVQPDGRIVAAAYGSLVRYLPDGSLDSGFGNGGYLATGFSADALALQPDRKIVVVGSAPGGDGISGEFAVARYNPDGSLDTSFGTDGVTNTAFPEPGPSPSATASALAVLPDGKIVAAGTSGWDDGGFCSPPSMFALARYSPDGTLDPTFGDGGLVQTVFLGQDQLAGIAVQPDGKIVASGDGEGGACPLRRRDVFNAPGTTTLALARYESDGSLDVSFGTGGKVTTEAGLGGPPILQDGKILVTGVSDVSDQSYPVIARYQANGRLDPTYAQQGVARIKRVVGYPTAALAQKDRKILVTTNNTQKGTSKLFRLLPNGRPDTSFGKGGIVSLPGAPTTALGSGATTTALALERNQKILVGGENSEVAGNVWTLARLIGGNNCVVPTVGGKTVAKATTTLRKSYCHRGHIAKRFSSNVPRGRVISTAPPRGTRLPGGAKVELVVSKGKRP